MLLSLICSIFFPPLTLHYLFYIKRKKETTTKKNSTQKNSPRRAFFTSIQQRSWQHRGRSVKPLQCMFILNSLPNAVVPHRQKHLCLLSVCDGHRTPPTTAINTSGQNLDKSPSFPLQQKLDKLTRTASFPALLKKDPGWGKYPCQAPVCSPASTAIIFHVICYTNIKKLRPLMGTPLLPSVHTGNKKTGPFSNRASLLALEQSDRDTQVFPLAFAPCWQHKILGTQSQIL